MAEQLGLFPEIQEPDYPEGATIQERFEAFHEANPHVLTALVELATSLQERGHARYGIAGLFEVLRYQAALRTEGDTYKLNNNFRSRYARLIMERVPRLEGFFEIRTLQTD